MRRSKRNIVINDETRLFIQSLNEPACNKEFNYHSCVSLGDVRVSKTETQRQYRQSDTRYDSYEMYDKLTGYIQPGSSTLSTNYPYEQSVLDRYFKSNCLFDMQVHFGKCENTPGNFAKFDKAMIFKGVELTSYGISALIASDSASRSKVTESTDFTFDTMYEVSRPNFILFEENIINDGPIIDSFTFCGDGLCIDCIGGNARYFVQLVSCGDDCQLVRVIYTNDLGNTWRVHNINICDAITCNQNVNTNLIENGDDIYYFGLNFSLGRTLHQILNNSLNLIESSQIVNTDINRAFQKYNTIFYVGNHGRIFISEDGNFNRIIHPKLSVANDILSIHSLNGSNFIAGSDDGKIFFGDTDGNIDYLVIPNSGNVNAVEMISDCSYVASTGLSGGVTIRSGKVERMKSIHGTITKFAFFNEDIGYSVSVSGNRNHIWQTVDGGKHWQEVDNYLSTNYVITAFNICSTNHNILTIAGRKMESSVTIEEMLNLQLNWDCLGSGFIYMTK